METISLTHMELMEHLEYLNTLLKFGLYHHAKCNVLCNVLVLLSCPIYIFCQTDTATPSSSSLFVYVIV